MSDAVDFLLGKGWIHDAETIYLYGATEEANDQDERWSVCLRRSAGDWGFWISEFRVCGLCTLVERGERVVLTCGQDGTVTVSDANGVHDAVVDPGDDSPNDLRHLSFVRPIGADVLAIGMSRMVYRRTSGSMRWSRLDDGMRLRRGTSEVAGLRSIDGDGHGRYLAVGLYGEIWQFEDSRWRQLDSPTNVKLESVKWVDDDHVYIAGAAGTLLGGAPHALKLFQDPEMKDTIWSIEWFRDRLYLATNKGAIYVLDGERLQRLELVPGATTGWLHAAAGLLLSVGSRHAMLFDGIAWTVLSPQLDSSDVPFVWSPD